MFSAIMQATLAGYRVINMSLGDYGLHSDKANSASWTAWDRIAKWADRNNALIVASMGNADLNLNGGFYHVPSDLPTVVGVAASGTSRLLDQAGELVAAPGSDTLGYRSNYGAAVELSGPGGDCGADYPNSCATEYSILSSGIDAAGNANYLSIFGTSMASAHVSAVAAYVRSIHPDWTTGEVREWLKDSAEPIGKNLLFGAGLVDADAAVR
jgi:subtilisin family serine protease